MRLVADEVFKSFSRMNRLTVIAHLKSVTQAFVRHIGQRKGLPQSLLDSAGGTVFTFGSYRLGVYGPGQPPITVMFIYFYR